MLVRTLCVWLRPSAFARQKGSVLKVTFSNIQLHLFIYLFKLVNYFVSQVVYLPFATLKRKGNWVE